MIIDPKELRKRGLIFNGRHLPYNPELKDRAQYFRENLTQTEKKFWLDFCKRNDYRWRTQAIIDSYIVDFYCPKLKLVIELDGLEHNKKDSKEYDAVRDNILESYGLMVIRIDNNDVNDDFVNCISLVKQEITKRLLPLNKSI